MPTMEKIFLKKNVSMICIMTNMSKFYLVASGPTASHSS